MLARRIDYEINYEGVNITEDLKKDLIDLSYTENASGASDDISLTLKDETKKWLEFWTPQQGDKISATLKTINWRGDGDSQQLFIGSFIVDEISPAGRPITVGIGGTSSPTNTDFMDRGRNKTWEDVTIKEIATEISARYGLGLVFDTSKNYKIAFLEQNDESDSSFLNVLCNKYAYSIKIFNDKIIIFQESEYEQKKVIKTINEYDMLSWSTSKTLSGTGYSKCNIKYKDINDNEYDYTFSIGEGKTLYINEVVDNYQEAQIVTKSRLREHNKSQNTLSSSLMGDLELYATGTVQINGLGKFNGKYYIDKVTHSIGSSFNTDLELHKVLEGY